MTHILLAIHVVVAIALVSLILVQHGKGAEMGAGFGAGASATVFGSQGSLSFLLKVTITLAAVFFATSILLGHLAMRGVKQHNHLQIPVTTTQEVPVSRSKQANKATSVDSKTKQQKNKTKTVNP